LIRGARVVRAVLLGWSALALWACTDSEARREAERVVVAVRALREADDADKPPRLAALRATECHAQNVCELKQECVGSYELYLSGLDAVRAVKKALASDAGDAATLTAGALLEKAEKDVQRGRERSTKCNEAEARVAAQFKL
jgi:hypothetical protein